MRSPACEVRTRGVPGSEDLVTGLTVQNRSGPGEDTMGRVEEQVAVDVDKLMVFVYRAVDEAGATLIG